MCLPIGHIESIDEWEKSNKKAYSFSLYRKCQCSSSLISHWIHRMKTNRTSPINVNRSKTKNMQETIKGRGVHHGIVSLGAPVPNASPIPKNEVVNGETTIPQTNRLRPNLCRICMRRLQREWNKRWWVCQSLVCPFGFFFAKDIWTNRYL